MASRAKCKSISGYLTLIQAWVYEHFPLLRPGDDIHVHKELPRMALWKDCRNHPGLQKNNIVLIREMLDSLEAEQIDFNPYLPTRDRSPLQDFAFFKGCLVANRISEPYMPDRYLRQLGHVQSIPGGPIQPIGKARRSRLASSYRVTYGSNVTQMEQWEDVLLGPRTRGHQIIKPWDTVSNYMGWFRRVSHPSISKPESRKYFRYSGNLGSTTPQEDWRTHISQYLQPLAQGRHSANVWQRHVQNVLDYCQDNVPLPSSSGPPKSPTRDRRSRRLNDA
ncbi:hypothetical protein QJS10_CPA06g00795 [Acorus calamus]|uniref:Aminotransferase-like plant mobile domain-containing protein n=1 Tax=Acorus calamus TaxID=4465 RepID=A0AAV9EP95_ACOCL|nr:hypothetical protein QJS10_CPA06g00795 [Acorus calamus]